MQPLTMIMTYLSPSVLRLVLLGFFLCNSRLVSGDGEEPSATGASVEPAPAAADAGVCTKLDGTEMVMALAAALVPMFGSLALLVTAGILVRLVLTQLQDGLDLVHDATFQMLDSVLMNSFPVGVAKTLGCGDTTAAQDYKTERHSLPPLPEAPLPEQKSQSALTKSAQPSAPPTTPKSEKPPASPSMATTSTTPAGTITKDESKYDNV